MADSVDRVFVHALNTVKRIPRTGSARPPPADRLRLYGLYKQSMEGDVDGVMQKPVGSSPDIRAEQEKWEAWNGQKGVSKTEAKRKYISTLIETMHEYASTTPDARELVAELEFVWNQIKSNVPSSASSSPQQNLRLRSRHGSIEADAEGPLRVLSPVSQIDEAEAMARGDDDAALERAGDLTAEQQQTGEARQRRWRNRIEKSLVRMTAEIAALREQMELRGLSKTRRRRSFWTWLVWFLWSAIRHVALDALLLGILFAWARRRRNQRLAQAFLLVGGGVKEALLKWRER